MVITVQPVLDLAINRLNTLGLEGEVDSGQLDHINRAGIVRGPDLDCTPNEHVRQVVKSRQQHTNPLEEGRRRRRHNVEKSQGRTAVINVFNFRIRIEDRNTLYESLGGGVAKAALVELLALG